MTLKLSPNKVLAQVKSSTRSKLIMLKKTDEFSSVFSFKKRFSSHFLIVYYKPSHQPTARTGFVIAKKVARSAVDRNYMRRVLRELCRQQTTVLVNVDMVLQVKKPFKKHSFNEVKQELASLFVKIQQILNPPTR